MSIIKASTPFCIMASSAFLLTAGSSRVAANAFRNPPPSASALALDGGKSVMVDDVSGQSANPALLVGTGKPDAAASITLIHAETEFTSAAGVKATTRNNLKTLPNIFAAIPVNSDLAFGLAITTPYGQSVEWPRESGLPYFTELRLVDISPALAVRLSDRISAGVGANVYLSDFESKQTIPWSMILGTPLAPDGSLSMKGDGSAVGATAGLLVQLTKAQRASLVYRAPFSIDYEGDARLAGTPAPVAATLPATTAAFKTEIDFPTVVAIGYAIDMTETLTLAAELEWIEFSRFESLPVDAGSLQASGLLPSAIPQQWEDAWTYGAAARWKCNDQFELRCSYRFIESPIPDRTLAPTLPDADKHVIGIGFGWHSNRLRISGGYAYSVFDDRHVSPSENPVLTGDYELSSHIVSTTVGLSF